MHNLCDLPKEILIQVFQFLRENELAWFPESDGGTCSTLALMRTSKLFFDIGEEALWTNLILSENYYHLFEQRIKSRPDLVRRIKHLMFYHHCDYEKRKRKGPQTFKSRQFKARERILEASTSIQEISSFSRRCECDPLYKIRWEEDHQRQMMRFLTSKFSDEVIDEQPNHLKSLESVNCQNFLFKHHPEGLAPLIDIIGIDPSSVRYGFTSLALSELSTVSNSIHLEVPWKGPNFTLVQNSMDLEIARQRLVGSKVKNLALVPITRDEEVYHVLAELPQLEKLEFDSVKFSYPKSTSFITRLNCQATLRFLKIVPTLLYSLGTKEILSFHEFQVLEHLIVTIHSPDSSLYFKLENLPPSLQKLELCGLPSLDYEIKSRLLEAGPHSFELEWHYDYLNYLIEGTSNISSEGPFFRSSLRALKIYHCYFDELADREFERLAKKLRINCQNAGIELGEAEILKRLFENGGLVEEFL